MRPWPRLLRNLLARDEPDDFIVPGVAAGLFFFGGSEREATIEKDSELALGFFNAPSLARSPSEKVCRDTADLLFFFLLPLAFFSSLSGEFLFFCFPLPSFLLRLLQSPPRREGGEEGGPGRAARARAQEPLLLARVLALKKRTGRPRCYSRRRRRRRRRQRCRHVAAQSRRSSHVALGPPEARPAHLACSQDRLVSRLTRLPSI